jgi:hypothetical protein
MRIALAAMIFLGALACRTVDEFIALATETPTQTPRPTLTSTPTATQTPVPTATTTATTAATTTPTKKAPTARPPTARPATAAPKAIQPTVSAFEFHANAATCAHSGLTYIKGTVYLDRNDSGQRYVGAIVALGAADGSTIYDMIKTNDNGEYSFILSEPGQGRQGTWGLWLVTPSGQRKSDIGGPIVTNGLSADSPNSCWAGNVDFWK